MHSFAAFACCKGEFCGTAALNLAELGSCKEGGGIAGCVGVFTVKGKSSHNTAYFCFSF